MAFQFGRVFDLTATPARRVFAVHVQKKRKGGKASLMKLDISIHPLSIDGIKLPGISVAYPTAVIKPKSQRKLSCKKSTSAKFSIAPSTGQMLVRAFGLF